MPQPIRAFIDAAGQAWLVLDNGHRIALPTMGGSGGGGTEPPPSGGVNEVVISDIEPTDPAVELWVDPNGEPTVPLDERYLGSGASFYEHTQAVLSTDWVVVHNLGRRPSVACRDAEETMVRGAVHHDSDTQLTIRFRTSCTGKAYCI